MADIQCRLCHNDRSTTGECIHCGAAPLPDDYETCGDCGFDHYYECKQATEWHLMHPCSYCAYSETGHELTCPCVCPVVPKGNTNETQ